MQLRSQWKKCTFPVLAEALLIALLPVLLLADPQADFALDWHNSLWTIQYYAAYFLHHHQFPALLNTQEIVGIAYPVFYGYGFYQLMGLAATVAPAALVILLSAYAFYALQHGLLVALGRELALPRWMATCLATMVTLAIYPLTNLYSRSALPEFFAGLALSIGMICLLFLLARRGRLQKYIWSIAAALALSFVVVTHPITALYGGLFLALYMLLLLVMCPRLLKENYGYWLFIAGSVLGVASPWIYATFTLHHDLVIVTSKFFALYKDSIDSIAERIFPLPVDFRMLTYPPKGVSTPYLEAPMNGCLLVVLCGFFLLCWRTRPAKPWRLLCFTALGACFFLLCLVLSLSESIYAHLPSMFMIIQFGYRMVTFQNLLLLGMFMGLALSVRTQALPTRELKLLFAMMVPVCLCAFTEKMLHAYTMYQWHADIGDRQEEVLSHLPESFYGYWCYATPDAVAAPLQENIAGHIELPVNTGEDFGNLGVRSVKVEHAGWYRTNIQPFRWGQLYVDGAKASSQQLGYIKEKHHVQLPEWYGQQEGIDTESPLLSVLLTPGAHEISYRFAAPHRWGQLQQLSRLMVLGLVIALVGGVTGVLLRKKEVS